MHYPKKERSPKPPFHEKQYHNLAGEYNKSTKLAYDEAHKLLTFDQYMYLVNAFGRIAVTQEAK